MLFSECWLKDGLLKWLEDMWYKEATEIQEEVIKSAIGWKNIIGQSQTGTWKTAAFLLPILNKIDMANKSIQALIIAPTRELANQIGDEIKDLTKFHRITYVCLFGWSSQNLQKQKLKRRPKIIVATPGRLIDFINKRFVDIRSVNYFVLDEVDIMLDMWFIRDIEKIWGMMKKIKQTYTFSATMNHKMKKIIQKHVSDAKIIKIWEQVTVDKINHKYLAIEHKDKLYNVINLIKKHPEDKIIIFTHTKRNTRTIHKILIWEKLSAELLNWDMPQGKRQSVLNWFKKGKVKILVTTDVAARWLNMENVGLVINFEVPIDAKSYVHRIGRTGRAWANWKAIMLVSPMEKELFRDVEKTHNIKIQMSDHIIEKNQLWKHTHVRLSKSTDKLSGRRWGKPNWWNRNKDRDRNKNINKWRNAKWKSPRSWRFRGMWR